MKKLLLIFSQIALCMGVLHAQEVIAPNGESYSNSSGQIQYTLGETAIETHETGLPKGFIKLI